MRFPFFALAAQAPFHALSPTTNTSTSLSTQPEVISGKMDTLNSGAGNASAPFAFKEGPEIFSPKDMLELARPGMGLANPGAGDLVLVPVSKYSFESKK
jgi:hypothetical protein